MDEEKLKKFFEGDIDVIREAHKEIRINRNWRLLWHLIGWHISKQGKSDAPLEEKHELAGDIISEIDSIFIKARLW